jgi:hypothetical protein
VKVSLWAAPSGRDWCSTCGNKVLHFYMYILFSGHFYIYLCFRTYFPFSFSHDKKKSVLIKVPNDNVNCERWTLCERWTNAQWTVNARWTNANEGENGKVERFRACIAIQNSDVWPAWASWLNFTILDLKWCLVYIYRRLWHQTVLFSALEWKGNIENSDQLINPVWNANPEDWANTDPWINQR